MKKHLPFLSALFLTAVILSFVGAHTTHAADTWTAPGPCPEGTFCPLAPIPGLTDTSATSVVQSQDLASFFNNLYKYLIGLAAAFAVIEIIWGGLEISTKDSVSKQSDGKARIQQALFGLLLVLSPVLVFSIINPSILNLSLNLPKLDTAEVPQDKGDVSGNTTTATDDSTGCTVTGPAGILQVAVCPSEAAANKWASSCKDYIQTTVLQKVVGGTATSVAVVCETAKRFMFVDVRTSVLSRDVNGLQPLAKTTLNPNNGQEAMAFANACAGANLEWSTCISDRPLTTFASDCALPPGTPALSVPGGATGKCYSERLTCGDHSGTGNVYFNTCASPPTWTIVQ